MYADRFFPLFISLYLIYVCNSPFGDIFFNFFEFISVGNINALRQAIHRFPDGQYNYFHEELMSMDKNELAAIIGSNLCTLRLDSGLTQEELAEAAGISTSFYANLERGNKGVSVAVLYSLAECLGVTVDRLLYEPTHDTHIKNLAALLKGKSPDFIKSVEKMVRLCIDEFSSD